VVTITVAADVLTAGSCVNRYTIARTYRATDVCGNFEEKTQTITVDDQVKPVITVFPANATFSCVSEVQAAVVSLVSATELCGGVVTITVAADVLTAGSCVNRYTIARTYRATDVCGNFEEKTQTITVDDQVKPVITVFPANATFSCVSEVPTADISLVSATDNCGGVVTITVAADVLTAGSCVNRYTIARTYRATDVCGNFEEKTQTITVDDQVKPVITVFPANATFSCVSEVQAAVVSLVSATELCGGVVTITVAADVLTAGSCVNRYTIARTYRATDVCGNFEEKTQTITVDDQVKPVITVFPANATFSCVSEVPTADISLVSATDNCGGVVTITVAADVLTAGSCVNRYTIARTYRATDVCGNFEEKTQTITVDDQVKPVITVFPANATFSCVSEVPTADISLVSATDNCGGVVTITVAADVLTAGSCVK